MLLLPQKGEMSLGSHCKFQHELYREKTEEETNCQKWTTKVPMKHEDPNERTKKFKDQMRKKQLEEIFSIRREEMLNLLMSSIKAEK